MKYLYCLLAVAVFIGCKKDEDDEPTKTEMLTSSSWKYESGGIDQDRNGSVDITFENFGMQPCVLDNFGTFNANGSGVADEGPTKCIATAAQTSAFNWNFANNEADINITGNGLFGLGGQFKIRELTNTRFAFSKDSTITMGPTSMTVGIIVNLKH